jgi:hypothetical protein
VASQLHTAGLTGLTAELVLRGVVDSVVQRAQLTDDAQLISALDECLVEKAAGLIGALADVPLLEVHWRHVPLDQCPLAAPSEVDMGHGDSEKREREILEVKETRVLAEREAMNLANNRLPVAAGIVNRIGLQASESAPGDARLPWPRAGANSEQRITWPVMWLSGLRDAFPLSNGRDPARARRALRSRQFSAVFSDFMALTHEAGIREEDDRGR